GLACDLDDTALEIEVIAQPEARIADHGPARRNVRGGCDGERSYVEGASVADRVRDPFDEEDARYGQREPDGPGGGRPEPHAPHQCDAGREPQGDDRDSLPSRLRNVHAVFVPDDTRQGRE